MRTSNEKIANILYLSLIPELVYSQRANRYIDLERSLKNTQSLSVSYRSFELSKGKPIEENILALLIAYQIIYPNSIPSSMLRTSVEVIYLLFDTLYEKKRTYDPSSFLPLIEDLISAENVNFYTTVGKVVEFLDKENFNKIIQPWMNKINELFSKINITLLDLKTLALLAKNSQYYSDMVIQNIQTLFDAHPQNTKTIIEILLDPDNPNFNNLNYFIPFKGMHLCNPDTINHIYESVIEQFKPNVVDTQFSTKNIKNYLELLESPLTMVIASKPKNFLHFVSCFKREETLISYPAVAQYLVKTDNIERFMHYLLLGLQVKQVDRPLLISKLFKLILQEGKPRFLNEFMKVLQANKHTISITSENNRLFTDFQASLFLVYGIKEPILSKYTPDNDFDTLIKSFDPKKITADMGVAAYFRIQNEIERAFHDCTNPFQVALKFLKGYLNPSSWLSSFRNHDWEAEQLIEYLKRQQNLQELDDACYDKIASNFRDLPEGKGAFAALLVFMLSPVFNVMAHAFIIKDNPNIGLSNVVLDFSSRLNLQSLEVFQKALEDNDLLMIQTCMDKGGFDAKSYTTILNMVAKKENALELLKLLLPKLLKFHIDVPYYVSYFNHFNDDIAVFLLSEGIQLYDSKVIHNNDLALNYLTNISFYIVYAITIFKPSTRFGLTIAILNALIIFNSKSLRAERNDFNQLELSLWENYEQTLLRVKQQHPDKTKVYYYNAYISIITSPIFEKLLGKLQDKYSLELGITKEELELKNSSFADATLSNPSPQKWENFIADMRSDQSNFDNINLEQISENPLPISKKVEIIGLLLQKNKYDRSKELPMKSMDSKSLATLFEYVQDNKIAHKYLSYYFVKYLEKLYWNANKTEKAALVTLFLEKTDNIRIQYTQDFRDTIYEALFQKFEDPNGQDSNADKRLGMPNNFADFVHAFQEPQRIAFFSSIYKYFIKYDAHTFFAYYLKIQLEEFHDFFEEYLEFMGIAGLPSSKPCIVDNGPFQLILDNKAHKCLQALLDALKAYRIDWRNLLCKNTPLSDMQKMIFFTNSVSITHNDIYQANSFRSMVTSINALNPSVQLGIAAFQHVMGDTFCDFTECTNSRQVAIALLEGYKKPSPGIFFTPERNQLENAKILIKILNEDGQNNLTAESIKLMQWQLYQLKDFKTYSALLIFLISPAFKIISAALIYKHNPLIQIEIIDAFDAQRDLFSAGNDSLDLDITTSENNPLKYRPHDKL